MVLRTENASSSSFGNKVSFKTWCSWSCPHNYAYIKSCTKLELAWTRSVKTCDFQFYLSDAGVTLKFDKSPKRHRTGVHSLSCQVWKSHQTGLWNLVNSRPAAEPGDVPITAASHRLQPSFFNFFFISRLMLLAIYYLTQTTTTKSLVYTRCRLSLSPREMCWLPQTLLSPPQTPLRDVVLNRSALPARTIWKVCDQTKSS